MREIKFRAWWIEKSIMLNDAHDFYDTLGDVERGNSCEPVNSFGQLLDDPKEYTVMQFTGLLDKNGKEIYEGDIVKTFAFDKTHTGEIYFQPTRLNWSVKHSAYANQDLFVYSRPDFSIENIGNIYETETEK